MDADREMMAAMGFAGFGNQTKKRKTYHENDHAVVAAPPTATDKYIQISEDHEKTLSRISSSPEPTVEPKIAPIIDTNKSNTVPTAKPENRNQNNKKKQAGPVGLAAFLQRGKALPDPPQSAPSTSEVPPAKPTDTLPSTELSLPARPPPVEMSSKPVTNSAATDVHPKDGCQSAPSGMFITTIRTDDAVDGVPYEYSREELAALRKGVPNEKGDMAYFKPSFIRDPWKAEGLK